MKRIILTIALLAGATAGKTEEIKIDQLANESALAYSKNYDYFVNPDFAKRVGVTVTYTSATPTTQTFYTGQASSGSITIVSTTGLAGTLVYVNGVTFKLGVGASTVPYVNKVVPFPAGAPSVTVSTVATILLSAVTNYASLKDTIYGSASAGVVSLFSKNADGINYILGASSPALVATQNLVNGVAEGVNKTTDQIYIKSHGLTTGLPVLYTATVTLGGLTDQVTYYAVRVDNDYIELSSSSADAQAGTAVDLTSAPVRMIGTTNANASYTLAPLAISGTPSFKWQYSNDANTWSDVVISSVTMTSYTYGGTTDAFDFGWFNFRWLRMAVIGPDTGGIYLKADLSKNP